MSRRINPASLGGVLEKELSTYRKEVLDRVDDVGRESMKKLVKMTKASAPVGYRGQFRRSITSREKPGPRGTKFEWGVNKPDYRLTHLLVHGHALPNGGRTRGDPFLKNALDVVLPEYEEGVKEAIER